MTLDQFLKTFEPQAPSPPPDEAERIARRIERDRWSVPRWFTFRRAVAALAAASVMIVFLYSRIANQPTGDPREEAHQIVTDSLKQKEVWGESGTDVAGYEYLALAETVSR
ncbi:MAG: hypothetical protein V1495_11405 [Pseudomonadota bacterium]